MKDRIYTFSFPPSDTSNAKNLSDKKETVATRTLINYDIETKEWREPIDARWYMARSADSGGVVYCSVWIRSACGEHYYAGSGSASGYGYCKHSQAFEIALRSAGIKCSQGIGGAGMSIVREAINELGKVLGWKNTYLAETN